MNIDISKMDKFDRKKKEVLDRLLGEGMRYPVPEDVTTRFTSPIVFGKEHGCFDHPVTPQNSDPSTFDPWLGWWNEQRRINNNKIVYYVDEPLDAEVPPPVK